MRKHIFCFLLCFLFILVGSGAFLFAEEAITITTYYPSPYGSYQDLYVANELGVGTTDPGTKLDVYSELTGGAGGHANQPIIRITQGRNTGYNIGDIHGELQFYTKDYVYSGQLGAIQGYIRAVSTRANGVTFADAGLDFGTTSGSGPVQTRMTIKGDGNVGIGETAPTALFEVACPAGFTNVKGGTPVNQLGCMETAEHGTGTWYVASNTCFTTYGGRLPIYTEWYNTMNNYTLTDETDDVEWLGTNDHWGSGNGCTTAGPAITSYSTYAATDTLTYRCWIPR